jgi:hypothetical protein
MTCNIAKKNSLRLAPGQSRERSERRILFWQENVESRQVDELPEF